MTKRFICLLLSAILLLGVLPVSPSAIAWAEELPAAEEVVTPSVKDLPETIPAETPPAEEPPKNDAAIPPEDETSADELPTEDTSENDTLTEITAEDEAEPLLYTADSGKCGDNVRWSISGTTLTISGTGAMWDYTDSPWYGRDITDVVVKSGVTSVGECAFADCWNLQRVSLPRSITTIQYGAFYYCHSLQAISIPSTVERIGERAFQLCGALSSVSLPDSITTVEPYAFSNCWNLQTVTMPKNLQTIGSGAFSYCNALSSISLPESVTDIAYFAFGWCGGLSSVKMPERLNSLGKAAFYNCYNLRSIDIPQGLTALSVGVFQNSGLQSVTIPEGITRIDRSAFFWCDSLTSCELPDSLLSIGDYAFEGCYNLRGIKLPSSLQTVGNYSFDDTGISSLTLPTSLRSVGARAFSYTNISSVTFPANLTYCDNSAFFFCSNLESIRVNSANSAYTSVDGVLFNKAKTTLLLYPCAKSGSLYTVPSTVTGIAAGAFETASNLGRVTIPDGVESIGEMAFAYCENLASVSIPKTVSSWGSYIFMECYNLKQVTLTDGLTTIGAYAFSWSGITTIDLPSSIRTINDSAFCGTGLTSIALPEGITELGENAFSYCSSLKTANLPISLEYIGSSAFADCTALETANYAGTYQQWCKNVYVSSNNNYLTNVLQYADSLRLSEDLAQMEGATLTLRSADGNNPVGESKITHGRVSLVAIADGNYSVTISRKGYVSAAVMAAVADNAISLSEELTMIRRGNVNGVNDVDIIDVQCLYEYLATRVPMGAFKNNPALLRQVGDVNEDGILNILDFEALYQQVVASSGGGGGSDEPYRIAMITDYGDITDQSFNQTTYEACKAFAEANGVDFQYFKPTGDSTAARVAMIESAVDKGYNVIVMPGYAFGGAIVEAAPQHKDVKFIALDVAKGDLLEAGVAAKGEEYDYNPDNWNLSDYVDMSNVYCAVYQEELCGYMAGYAAVKLGYKNLGFLGGMAVPAVVRYGYGFVQGIDTAAAELKLTGVKVNYVYGNQFFGDADITAKMDTWYAGGTEVVFACGGGIYTSAVDAAKKVEGAKVIGVDVDQTGMIANYAAGAGADKATVKGFKALTVTSAMKGLYPATYNTLTDVIVNGNWSKYVGRIATLGLVSADDPSANYVQIPMDSTQWADSFTQDDYKALVAKMLNNELTVSNDIKKAASDFSTVITVDDQGTIK